MDARDEWGVRAGVFLRDGGEPFNRMLRFLGAKSDLGRSRLLDVDPRTISRAREGIIGEQLIAKVIALMERHAEQLAAADEATTFEDIFEIGPKKVAA